MKSSGNTQPDHAFGAGLHGVVHRQLHASEVPADDHLTCGVEVRRDTHAGFVLRLLADRNDGFIIESDHGGHRTGPLESGGVHQFSAQAHGEHGLGEIERARRDVSGELPQGVPRGHAHLAEAALDDPAYRSGMDEHRRLGVFREYEVLLGPLPSEFGDREPQDVVRLFEHTGGLGISIRQGTAHPHVLGALSREKKCEAHDQGQLIPTSEQPWRPTSTQPRTRRVVASCRAVIAPLRSPRPSPPEWLPSSCFRIGRR